MDDNDKKNIPPIIYCDPDPRHFRRAARALEKARKRREKEKKKREKEAGKRGST